MSMVQLEVYNPSGATEMVSSHAPRLDTLSGKTIAELSNAEWEYSRTFALIRELLQKRFPDAKIIPYTEFPQGTGTGGIGIDGIERLVKDKTADAVIVGNAA